MDKVSAGLGARTGGTHDKVRVSVLLRYGGGPPATVGRVRTWTDSIMHLPSMVVAIFGAEQDTTTR